MSVIAVPRQSPLSSAVDALNTRYHKLGLRIFMAIVLAHWAEHIVQAFQIWGLGMERPAAKGVLGFVFPWLVESEALHYGYAIIMLVGLILFRPGFVGQSRRWWDAALVIQFWHHIEHFCSWVRRWPAPTCSGSLCPRALLSSPSNASNSTSSITRLCSFPWWSPWLCISVLRKEDDVLVRNSFSQP